MQQMMKVRGTTLYPQAVYSALDRIPGVAEYYLAVSSRDSLSDELTVHVAVNGQGCSAGLIEDKLQAKLRVKPRVVVEAEAAIREVVFTPKFRKPVRFVDLRKRL
jgi:phenylacetate-CoA ligase